MGEIRVGDLNAKTFIDQKVNEIKNEVGGNLAVIALSGGVDSSVTAVLGHKAIGDRLRPYFIDTGLMREGEAGQVEDIFRSMGISITVAKEQKAFLEALMGVTDPEQKRERVSETFYKNVFSRILKEMNIRYLLQGTIYSDIAIATAYFKRHHNVLAQLGIDTESSYGYSVIEPLAQLTKEGVRMVAKELGMPEKLYNRMPFPGPALSIRVLGEVTKERLDIVREATSIVEDELSGVNAFQYLAILHSDRVVGRKGGKRMYGPTIEIRCNNYSNLEGTTQVELDPARLRRLSERIIKIPAVASVVYNVTPPPACMVEAE